MTALVAALVVLAAGIAVRVIGMVAARTEGRRPRPGLSRSRFIRAPTRRSRPDHELPDRLEAVARALRGGASLRSALVDTAPAGPDPLAGLTRRVAAGYSVRDAVTAWPEAHRDAAARLAATGLLAAGVVGGPQARIVDAAALALRERVSEGAERRAQAAQARASAGVLVALPVVVGGWSALTDRRVGAFLFTTPVGMVCAGTGVALIVLGALWMGRLVRGEP
jgi:tight adherence protein B